MKYLKLLISTFSIFILFSANLLAQPLPTKTDSSKIALQELINPSFQNLLIPPSEPNNKLSQVKSWKPSTATKLLLGIGTSLIRGNNENYQLYSLENAWKYPGPTIRYPESVSEYESFLRRFDHYNPDSK